MPVESCTVCDRPGEAMKNRKKTGTRAKAINTDEIEDSHLAALIEKGMKTKSVRRESVMESLGQ